MLSKAVSRWIFVISVATAQIFACEKGWFGTSCQYKCRCLTNSCDSADGSCEAGSRCQIGWFGPACQYADLANSDTVINKGFTPLSVLTDGNEDTCLSMSIKEVSVRWTLPYQITWIRVQVQDSYLLNRFTVTFKTNWNRQVPCHNVRMTRVSEKIVDIYCDMNVTVSQLILSWEGKAYLCSLYISGGRNVALKQNTSQSSTDPRIYITSASVNAVDGDRNSDYIYGNCAQTVNTDLSPRWSVTLGRNFTVNRYVLYHKIDPRYFVRRAYWFSLAGLDVAGNEVLIDKGLGATKQNVYRITTATFTSPIASVSIQSTGTTQRSTASPSALSLCEVEVYGDSICEPGQYGRDCEHNCNCADEDEQCSVSTGGCLSGCKDGFTGEGCIQPCRIGTFGHGCNSTCTQLCLANTEDVNACNHINGTCLLGCQIGYEGQWCNITCPAGKYGLGCSSACSDSCSRDSNNVPSCHHLHGVCLHGCKPGYTGLMCDQSCSGGKFGTNCSLECPRFCLSNNRNIGICEPTTGMCVLGCQAGYDGLWCNTTCTAGSYGSLCRSPCPQYCNVNSANTPVCNHIHGACQLGCQPGYTGSMCEEICEPGLYGQDCRDTCSTSCAVDSSGVHYCHHVSGACLWGCQTGYDGIWCNKTCDNGLHGKDCNSPCPQFCGVSNIDFPVCHHVHGTCLQGCQIGHTGVKCNETCQNGTYGSDCSLTCSRFCQTVSNSKIPVCHYATGTCLRGCQPGYTGLKCVEECEDGKYGIGCVSECSQQCIMLDQYSSSCNHINGSCLFGCMDGYDGHNCTIGIKVMKSELYEPAVPQHIWIVPVLLVSLVLAAVGAIFWWKRRKIRSQMFNIAVQVRLGKTTGSAENIIKTDLSPPDIVYVAE